MVQPLRYYCQMILPAVYDDGMSYMELVYHLMAYINQDVIGAVNGNTQAISELQAGLTLLDEAFEAFREHGFDNYYEQQVTQWIDQHLTLLLEQGMKQVYFGLTLDGHFVAYIPDSWDDIAFDTGYVYGSPDYGRLILMWDVDSPHDVQQP